MEEVLQSKKIVGREWKLNWSRGSELAHLMGSRTSVQRISFLGTSLKNLPSSRVTDAVTNPASSVSADSAHDL